MANVEQIPAGAQVAAQVAAKGPSVMIQVAMLLAMTVAALGIGWVSGSYLKSSEATAKAPAAGTGESSATEAPAAVVPLIVTDLPSITTNLAAPAETWVRMDISLLLDQPLPLETVQTIHQDLLTFMRTVKMHQVEGASGFLHLKADLQERAAMRGDGHVRDVLIRTLLFE